MALAVVAAGLISSAAPVPAMAKISTPQRLYDEVWRLINARFVDPSDNGQEWYIWRHRYDEQLQTEEDAYVAIRSMLASLDDRYTRFLDPKEFDEEGQSIRATLFGIGIQIGSKDGKIVVISPIEDTPAERAGLKANDIISQIEGEETEGWTTSQAADKIRGEKGSPVKLTVIRGKEKPRIYTIIRDEIKLKSVYTEPPVNLKPNIGYIRISSFLSKQASTEFKEAYEAQSAKDGFILDLRSNPGGLLSNAITIANYFLPQGGIVSTVDRDGYKETRFAGGGVLTSKPLVVLVNEGSASASEILSGALRDNNRALLVGHKTFGKGLVQEINALPGGSGVNITTQKYLTPNDTDINKVGIIPDIHVDMPDLKSHEPYNPKVHGDPQLSKAESVLMDLIAGKSLKYLQTRSLIERVEKDDFEPEEAELN
ncbi:MAG: S41 family peptidase [Cyanobacteria bacterium HKST-UBA06]|nr:S41 family peptidase [Cyanobacteria bacterium HKST-UBA06]